MPKSSAAAKAQRQVPGRLLGIRAVELPELLRVVGKGFAFSALERLQHNSGLEMDEITGLIQMSRRTLTRRRQEGRFAPDESDRLLRAARLLGKAIALFEGDSEAANRWLRSPQTAFGGTTPLEMAKTEVGAREVETLIDRLEQGVYS